MARLFNHVLLQQTQPEDSQGAITITNMYTTWSVKHFLYVAVLFMKEIFHAILSHQVTLLVPVTLYNSIYRPRFARLRYKDHVTLVTLLAVALGHSH